MMLVNILNGPVGNQRPTCVEGLAFLNDSYNNNNSLNFADNWFIVPTDTALGEGRRGAIDMCRHNSIAICWCVLNFLT